MPVPKQFVTGTFLGWHAVTLFDQDGNYVGAGGGSTSTGRYNAAPPTRAEAETGPLQTDSQGRVLVYNSSLMAGEDLTNDVQKVETRWRSSYITTAADTNAVATGAGVFGGLQFLGGTAGLVTVYDSLTAGTGTVLFAFTPTSTVPSPEIGAGIKFATGISIRTAAATLLLAKYGQGTR